MHRRIVVLLCVWILTSLAASTGQAQSGTWSLEILEADEHHLLLELTLPSFESNTVTHDGIQYQRLQVAGWGSWGRPGQPQLPMQSVPLGMPWPGDPHISVIEVESETVEGMWLYPVPALALGGTEEAPRIVETFAFDAEACSADTVYPGPLAKAEAIGLLRDRPVFQLRLYPLQYNPLRRELRVYRRLRVQVTFPAAPPSLAGADRIPPPPVFERILEQTLLNYDSLPPAVRLSSPDSAPMTVLDGLPQVKLSVEQDGLYRVTYGDLQAVAPELVQGDPRLLELSNQDSAVSILFDGQDDGTFDPGDSFVFYGQAIYSDYTRQNVYWLRAGSAAGLRMAQRDGTPGAGSTPAAFGDTRYYEKDRVCWRALPNGEGKDHWFWDELLIRGTIPVSTDYAFDVHHIAAGGPDGKLRLMLHGATYGDHLTQLYLNGVALLSSSERAWSGQVEKLYDVAVPQNLFVEGTNHLRVENILPTGRSSSKVYVNWFEITYRDTFIGEDDYLLFSAPSAGTYVFELTGFSTTGVELFDVTNPAAPVQIINWAVEPDGGSYRLRFGDSATANRKYLAQADQWPTPAIQLDEPSAWRSAANGATYLIVTHPSFYDAVQPLAAYRSSQGETVVTVKTEDIYDEFFYGIVDPQAIRSFLAYAYDHWSPRPVYVLLMGDASLDPKNNRTSSLSDLLPAYYVDTLLFGQTPNDSWYAKVHGDDDYPDVIVGRVPARYASDVATVAGKVQMYEESPPPGDWVRRAVLVADDGDATFTQDMDTVAGMLPESMTPVKVYNYDPGASVQDEVSEGALLLAYSGHGDPAGSLWGKWSESHRIFDQSQIQDLWNGNKLSFMTVANCLNGLFDQYDRSRTMAEEFLLLNNKGGIASWAPASYGFATTNNLILDELYQALLVDGDLTLGSVATTARLEAYLRRPDLPLSLFEAFTYFGDPAVRLNVPAVLELDGQDSPDPVVMGEMVTWTLTYNVSGADRSRGLTLVNTLPQQVTYQSALPAPSSIYAQSLTWHLGDTLAGSYTVTVTGRVQPDGLAHGQILQNQAHLYDVNGGDQVVQLGTAVHDIPIAGLSASNDGPTELGSATTLSATVTSGTNVVHTWDFGDGSPPQTGSSVRHTYPAVGTYVVWVTATNGVSSQSQTTTVIITDVPPSAGFISSSPDRIGQTTTFQSISGGTNLTYQWDFGDGSLPVSSQEPTMTHEYTSLGSFGVVLTVTNSVGSDVATGDIVIRQTVIKPVAHFISSSPDEWRQATSFINASQDGGDDEENVSYEWDFGDGNLSTVKHPTHTYATPGTYFVSFTISNSVGSDTFGDTVTIIDEPIAGLAISHNSPTPLGHITTLAATTISGTNMVYLWAFGDGALGHGQNPAHIYGAMGSYAVVLTATNNAGSQVAAGTIIIVDELVEGLTISHDGPTFLKSPTTFAARVTAGTNLSYLWELGDGTTSTLQNPAHTYGAVGDYTVVLTVTNSRGSLVKFDTVSIRDVPISGLNIRHSDFSTPEMPAILTAVVDAGTNVVYNWDLGDGNTATGSHVSHTYAVPGTYYPTVTASNGTNVVEASTTVLAAEQLVFLPAIFVPPWP